MKTKFLTHKLEATSVQKKQKSSFTSGINNGEKTNALFPFYKTNDGKILMELREEQLNKPFLMTITLKNIIGTAGWMPSSSINNFALKFQKTNDSIHLIMMNPNFKAKNNTPESTLAVFPIISNASDKKTFAIDANKLFLSDIANLSNQINSSFDANYSFDSDKSVIEKARAYPHSIEVETKLNFYSSALPKDSFILKHINQIVPDPRSLPLKIHYSISQMPRDNYIPREADNRIGYFEVAVKDFSNHKGENSTIRYIERWNLKNKPVTFWIENTVPLEFRKAIKEGVLEWNKAFKQIGIYNAITVQEQPDNPDWETGDMRYNVIRWVNTPNEIFGGEGITPANPFTGEIYNATIILNGNPGTDFRSQQANEENKKTNFNNHACNYPSFAVKKAYTGILAENLYSKNSNHIDIPRTITDAIIKEVVMHEVGHCLGLRHNFHGSAFFSPKELSNPTITHKHGTTGSIMDYNAFNVFAVGKKGGDYFSPTIGPYDYWAIEYGYKPINSDNPASIKKELTKIINKSSKPENAYGTDEDLYYPFSLDPLISSSDLSNNPLMYAEKKLEFNRKLWKNIDGKLPHENEGYEEVRNAFDHSFHDYLSMFNLLVSFIGGVYFNRANEGDVEKRKPFVPVEKSKQIEALNLIDKYLFNHSIFSLPPDFLNKLAPDRQNNTFASKNDLMYKPIDYPFFQTIIQKQDDALDGLFNPIRLNRLVENERRVIDKEDTYTMPELFEWLKGRVWEEKQFNKDIPMLRRELQKSHIEKLIKLATSSNANAETFKTVPGDAKSLAIHQLNELQKKLQKTLKSSQNKLNIESKAHLEFCLSTINKNVSGKVAKDC